MALYVIAVPPPAVGHDWLATVPGQYVYDIVGVTATLVTGTTPTIIPDESGNGRDATRQGGSLYTIGNAGPFGGGADNYATFHPDATGNNGEFAQAANSLAFDGGSFSAEQWCYVNKPGVATTSGLFSWFNNAGTHNRVGLSVQNNPHDPYDVFIDESGGVQYAVTGVATRGAWHLIGWSYDGTHAKLYVDGALVDNTTTGVPPNQAVGPVLASNGDLGVSRGFCAAPAFFGAALTAGQFAAHYAAAGSYAAYKAAVIADGAAGLWNIGKPATGPGRIVDLRITDGTNTVQEIPAGFALPANNEPAYVYSWQTTLNSSTQTPDGTTTTVAIPDLILPAGYTIGSHTLDLAGTDQWTNINIWWNSDVQDVGGTLTPYAYPPGAFLKYVQRTQR